MSTPPTASESRSSNKTFFGCLGLLALLILAGVVWLYSTLPKVKEYTPPDQLELTTLEVPASRQVLVLVEHYTESPYIKTIRQEINSLTAALSDDQRICLFQVASDQSVMPVEPWCSRQVKSTWWVMPDIKPAPYNTVGEERAYREATGKLEAELKTNTDRAEMAWGVERENRMQQVNNLLWQLPDQPYRSLVDSLARLLQVRHLAGGQTPTDLVIYSGLVDQLFTERVQQSVDLSGMNVQVKVMAVSEAEKDKLVALWEPWFQAGKPAKLTFSLLEPGADHPVAPTKSPRPVAQPETAGLPTVVPKPTVADRTNVIQGESITGDATNVTREVE